MTSFFTEANQMDLSGSTRAAIAEEGLIDITNLVKFDSDSMKHITDHLHRPGRRVPDLDPDASDGATILTHTFVFGAKSQIRLKAAVEIAKYYKTTGRDLTTEDFPDFNRRVIGTRTIPLSYVIREIVDVPNAAPALSRLSGGVVRGQFQPLYDDFGSVEEELIACATHSHPLYCDDNAAIYLFLEEATRCTMYASSIEPYSRHKDERGAWLALTNQYTGQDKCSADLNKQDNLLHTLKCKGQSNFSLNKFIAQHRNAFVSMKQSYVHVAFQLPNEYTRVAYLLDAIETFNAALQAAMALVRNDTNSLTGKCSDFEATTTCLFPYDPVAKKRNTCGENDQQRGVEVSSISSSTIKFGVGSTGVDFRYHKLDEYMKLSDEHKSELHEWRFN